MTGNDSIPSQPDLDHLEKTAVLDDEILTALKGLERPSDKVSFLNDLIETFVRETPQAIRVLVEALEQKKMSASLHAAHQLKGLSGNIGVIRLAAFAEWIEGELEASRFPDPGSVSARFHLLREDAVFRLNTEWKR